MSAAFLHEELRSGPHEYRAVEGLNVAGVIGHNDCTAGVECDQNVAAQGERAGGQCRIGDGELVDAAASVVGEGDRPEGAGAGRSQAAQAERIVAGPKGEAVGRNGCTVGNDHAVQGAGVAEVEREIVPHRAGIADEHRHAAGDEGVAVGQHTRINNTESRLVAEHAGHVGRAGLQH